MVRYNKNMKIPTIKDYIDVPKKVQREPLKVLVILSYLPLLWPPNAIILIFNLRKRYPNSAFIWSMSLTQKEALGYLL